MESLLYFKLRGCPYCMKADKWLEELKEEEPAYRRIPLRVIVENEEKELADSYDYYYVPCFFYNGKKLHEGAATKAKLRKVLDQCL